MSAIVWLASGAVIGVVGAGWWAADAVRRRLEARRDAAAGVPPVDVQYAETIRKAREFAAAGAARAPVDGPTCEQAVVTSAAEGRRGGFHPGGAVR